MVVNPLSVNVKLLVLATAIVPFNNCGANPGTAMVRTVGVEGVTLKPSCNKKDGVITMLPDVVPDCRETLVAFPLNSAWVVLAGIVKVTVVPPLAN